MRWLACHHAKEIGDIELIRQQSKAQNMSNTKIGKNGVLCTHHWEANKKEERKATREIAFFDGLEAFISDIKERI